MKTIEEVKLLLSDNVNWGEILKDVVIQKFGENKIISSKGVYSHSIGDPDAYLVAVIVSNGKVFVYSEYRYHGDSDGFQFGLLETDCEKTNRENYFISQNALKEFTRKLIYGEEDDNFIEYDFDNELSEKEREKMYTEYVYNCLFTDFYEELKETLENGKGSFYY